MTTVILDSLCTCVVFELYCRCIAVVLFCCCVVGYAPVLLCDYCCCEWRVWVLVLVVYVVVVLFCVVLG